MTSNDRFTFLAFLILLVVAAGGLLFGYNTTVLAGALSKVSKEFSLSTFDQGFLTGIILLGGLAGALCAGASADRWGRKNVLIATALLFCISTLIQAYTHSYTQLLCGRFLSGIAVGINSVVAPVYLAEVSPPHYRGGFVSSYQLAIAVGILFAYAINLIFAQFPNWRGVYFLGFVPSFVQWIALFFIPETPGWLLRHHKERSAVAAIEHLRADREWKSHLPEMEATASPETKGRVKQLMQPHLKRFLVVGLLLSTFQQITGVNTVLYYAPKIFSKGGTSQTALLITLIIGAVNLLAALCSVVFLDRWGRRKFLLFGTSAMIVGQILLAISTPIAGIVGALIYVLGFGLGLGPITWVLLSEIYPLKIRGKAMGLALFANWLFNYIVSLTFLLLLETLTLRGTFILYGCLSLLCLIFIYTCIPETKGKSLEEIEFLAAKGEL
jgi:MFS transporter, SP family, galactose:H+ symporter